MATRPNILLIVMDQFRSDLLGDGALGQTARLPHLRALMREAVTFDRHFSVVSPCGPSRVSLLTGQYAMNHRAVRNGTPLRRDTANLATSLAEMGYTPELFGYTDTAQDPRGLSPDDPRLASYEELMPGFVETVRMRMESDDRAWRAHLAAKGINLPPYPASYRPDGEDIADPALYPAEDSDTAFLTDRFLDAMDGAEAGWCATLTYIRPHPPLVAPAPYNRMYDPTAMPPARKGQSNAGDRDWHPFLASAQDKQPPRSMVEGFPDLAPSDETTARLRAVYLGLASEVDHHIGRIVAWLKASGQWDDTILVVTADHGEMLGDFGLWGKGTFHDAAFHIPLILRDPSRPAMHGRRVTGMTESIDLAPTLLTRVGADVPDSMNGQSLIGALDDTGAETKPMSVSEYDFGHPVRPTPWMERLNLTARVANLAVLRTERHRIVQFAGDVPPILFDMEGAGEGLDISDRTSSMPIMLDLTRKMLCHRMTHADSTFARTIVGDGGVTRGML